MQTNYFKPELWSRTILNELDVITGMRKHSDYSFTDEIKYGTILHITKMGDTSIHDYTIPTGASLTSSDDITIDNVNGGKVDLVIDQQRYFAKYYDDIDKVQSIPGAMENDMKETAKALAVDADEFVSATLYKAVVAGTITASTATTITKSNIITLIESGLVALYENNVDVATEIWGEFSPAVYSVLRQNLTELATQNLDLMKRGIVGRYNNVNVCIENRLPVKTNVRYNFLRTGKALAYAEQIDKVNSVDREKGFGQIFKGLMVYGAAVVRPEEAYAIEETTSGVADSTFISR